MTRARARRIIPSWFFNAALFFRALMARLRSRSDSRAILQGWPKHIFMNPSRTRTYVSWLPLCRILHLSRSHSPSNPKHACNMFYYFDHNSITPCLENFKRSCWKGNSQFREILLTFNVQNSLRLIYIVPRNSLAVLLTKKDRDHFTQTSSYD